MSVVFQHLRVYLDPLGLEEELNFRLIRIVFLITVALFVLMAAAEVFFITVLLWRLLLG